MSTKLTVFLSLVVLAVIFVQNSQAKDNKAEELLRKLRDSVHKALAQAQEALDNAEKKVNDAAAKTQDAAKNSMQSTIDKFRAEIDSLKEKAKQAGVNIDECLAGNEDKLLNLPNQLSNDMIHCVSDKINEGIGYARDALNQVQKVVNDVENVKDDIKNCGHGFRGVKCIAKLAVKLEKDIVTLPTKIQADIAATVVLISTLEEKVKKCASSKVDQCESDGKQILGDITLCAAKKIIL